MVELPSHTLLDLRDPNVARPSIVVLLPVFNAERWLEYCLKNLSENTEPHDLVIVDDGSFNPVDESVVRLYIDKIVIIRMGRNSGIVNALNVGLNFIYTQGYQFIARQDADDVSRSDRLSRQVVFMRANPDIALCGSSADIINIIGDRIGVIAAKAHHSEIWRSLCFSNQFVHSTFFLRSSHIREIGFYDPRLQGSEDYDIAFRIGKRYGLANIPEPLLAYRVHSASISSNRLPQAITNLRVAIRHFRPGDWRSYAGIAKKIALLPAPRSWILKSKLILRSWRRL